MEDALRVDTGWQEGRATREKRKPSPRALASMGVTSDVDDPSANKRPCLCCRRSKVRCDRADPCGRCRRLGLECEEQVRVKRGPSRPPRTKRAWSVDSGVTHAHLSPESSPILTAIAHPPPAVPSEATVRVLYTKSRSDSLSSLPEFSAAPFAPAVNSPILGPCEAAAAAEKRQKTVSGSMEGPSKLSGMTAASVSLGMAARAAGFFPQAASPSQITMSAFFRLHAQGKVSRGKTLAVMRACAMWQLRSETESVVRRLTSLSTTLCVDWRTMLTDSECLREAYGVTEGHVLPQSRRREPDSLDHYLREVYAGSSAAAMVVVIADGIVRFMCSERFSANIATAGELELAVGRDKADPLDVLGRPLSKDDHPDFFESVSGMLFTSRSPRSEIMHIVKCTTRHSDPYMALAQVRSLISEGGCYHAMVLSLQRLPHSRYLLPLPISMSASSSTTNEDAHSTGDEDDTGLLLPADGLSSMVFDSCTTNSFTQQQQQQNLLERRVGMMTQAVTEPPPVHVAPPVAAAAAASVARANNSRQIYFVNGGERSTPTTATHAANAFSLWLNPLEDPWGVASGTVKQEDGQLVDLQRSASLMSTDDEMASDSGGDGEAVGADAAVPAAAQTSQENMDMLCFLDKLFSE